MIAPFTHPKESSMCLLRDGFRHFRVDRIDRLTVSDERYPDQRGRRLDDFFAALEREEGIRIRRR